MNNNFNVSGFANLQSKSRGIFQETISNLKNIQNICNEISNIVASEDSGILEYCKENDIIFGKKLKICRLLHDRNDLCLLELPLIDNGPHHPPVENNQFMGIQDFCQTVSQFHVHKPKIQHVLIEHRQVIVHMLLLHLFHGKAAHSLKILLVHFRTGILCRNDITVENRHLAVGKAAVILEIHLDNLRNRPQ